jgi:hypothetical protein
MNKYTVEVARLGQDILDLASSEFEDNFSIVARTQELLVLGNGLKKYLILP